MQDKNRVNKIIIEKMIEDIPDLKEKLQKILSELE